MGTPKTKNEAANMFHDAVADLYESCEAGDIPLNIEECNKWFVAHVQKISLAYAYYEALKDIEG